MMVGQVLGVNCAAKYLTKVVVARILVNIIAPQNVWNGCQTATNSQRFTLRQNARIVVVKMRIAVVMVIQLVQLVEGGFRNVNHLANRCSQYRLRKPFIGAAR